MDTSDTTKKKQPGNFWQGFLISLAGWILDAWLAYLFYSIFEFLTTRVWEWEVRGFQIRSIIAFSILLAVIWVPVAVIAGIRSRKKGFKASLPLVLKTFFIAPLLVGCGFSMLAYYFIVAVG